jgi:hypothetical protein
MGRDGQGLPSLLEAYKKIKKLMESSLFSLPTLKFIYANLLKFTIV